MKYFLQVSICWLLLSGLHQLAAQPFYSYQTIGVHTWFASVSWNGQQPELGIGYGLRRPVSGFAEWTAEWRAPLSELFTCQAQTVIVGAYGPARLQSRRFLGMGLHLRWQTYASDGDRHDRVSLAGTLIPSYTFAAPLNDQPYFTGGLRLTGLLVLADKAKSAESPTWLPAFGTELGLQSSLHLERSMGLSLNAFGTRYWRLQEAATLPAQDEDWSVRGDVNWGTTYHLRRAF